MSVLPLFMALKRLQKIDLGSVRSRGEKPFEEKENKSNPSEPDEKLNPGL